MADRTTAEETMPREELADYLEQLASEFRSGNEEIHVRVGNKNVSLNPPETVDVDVEVVERSSMLRGQHESIDIEMKWKP
ncbi:amphi-Trp domain-containing protein [Natrialbaceae archaeon GCM10025810]|uniref:amphi-Trp domain-containing protein n=1 Tax=Halovalidus salilacus TaxID=3075124 RepID=UPI003613C15A